MMRLSLSWILVIVHSVWLTAKVGEGVSPDCPKKCGNVSIPSPFGIGSECSHNASFAVTCNDTMNPSPKPYLSSIGGLEVVYISVTMKTVTVMLAVSPLNCSSAEKILLMPLGKSLVGTPFIISSSLAVVGCKSEVWLTDLRTNSSSLGCRPICGYTTSATCLGINCCQFSSSVGGPSQVVEIHYRTYEQGNDDSVCGFAFLADYDWLNSDYKNNYKSFQNHSNPLNMSLQYVPMSLSWQFLDISAHTGQGVSCYNSTYGYSDTLDDNITLLINTTNCYCDIGFQGNPYDPTGCKDVDECSNKTLNICAAGTTCLNTMGNFTCHPDDNINHMKSLITGISSGVGALLLLTGAWLSSKLIRKRIKANRRNDFFKRNGGLLLQQQLSSNDDGSVDRVKIFSSKELALATDRYNEDRIVGRGGQGTVYKGMLPDGRIVAVKKSKKMNAADIEVFINEVVILSQINHRNVVKLLGCCLETKVPILVYEFITNGTLFQHIHDQSGEFLLSWKMRVRMATEVAGAVSYLHNAASVPIYHRDIKSTNILLDDKYRAKVSDFGTSRSVAIDQTHLTTRVLGTFGYLDPEYFQSSQFTEKSDVYSFGVVMIELLTGEKAVSTVRAETGRSLAMHFLQSMEENNLSDILDPEILKEGRMEEIVAVAKLARRCLNLNGKRRPTMKEVAAELVGIQMMKDGSISPFNLEDKDFDSIEISEDYDFTSTSESTNLNIITAESSESPLLSRNT